MSYDELQYAVMEDDTILCRECIEDDVNDGGPEDASSMIHAWVAHGPCRRGCPTPSEPGATR